MNAVFEPLSPTVKKLDLDKPQSTHQGLICFLSNFPAIESLVISSPEWVPHGKRISLAEPRPPFTGKLSLSKFQRDSSAFLRFLSMFPVNFSHITVVDCDWDPLPFSRLLRRVTHSLKYLAVSAWFNGTFLFIPIRSFPADDVAPRKRICIREPLLL